MLRILYVSESVIPSRTANSLHVMKMCEAFADHGHEVTLLAPDRDLEYEAGVVDVHAFYGVSRNFQVRRLAWSYAPFGWLLYCAAVSREILAGKADLIYSRYLQGCMAAAVAGRKFVFESHSPIRQASRVWSSALRMLAGSGRLQALVVISEALRKAYLEESFPAEKAPILLAHDAAGESGGDSRLEGWPCRPGCLQVGYVGQLYPGKGVEVVEKVAPLLPDADFHVIGGFDADIAAWKARGLPDNVRFHGFVPQERLSRHINCLDVCLLPNQRVVRSYGTARGASGDIGEYTSPLKMFEYMAHRKAIVSSDLPVLREVLNSGNAVLVDPCDAESWARAIGSLADPMRRRSLADRAYEDFRANHTWTARAAKLLDALGMPADRAPTALAVAEG
jgi:glycosyltransferase involved in cell wall biosynthesis